MVEQVLATGVHGIMLPHATTPAVRALVEAIRYPTASRDRSKRGAHGAAAASNLGHHAAEYVRAADLWPLNPEGELLLGVKIEDNTPCRIL
jgi:4-hydroxy-2-oxoheptanedioate aldolase